MLFVGKTSLFFLPQHIHLKSFGLFSKLHFSHCWLLKISQRHLAVDQCLWSAWGKQCYQMGLMPSRAKKLDVLLVCSRFSVKLCERMRTVHGWPIVATQWGVTPSLSPHFPCMRARRQQEAIEGSIECYKGKEVGKVPVTPHAVPLGSANVVFLG